MLEIFIGPVLWLWVLLAIRNNEIWLHRVQRKYDYFYLLLLNRVPISPTLDESTKNQWVYKKVILVRK